VAKRQGNKEPLIDADTRVYRLVEALIPMSTWPHSLTMLNLRFAIPTVVIALGISGCSDGSTSSQHSQQEPFTANATGENNLALSDATVSSRRLFDNLVTGRDGDDANSFWLCKLELENQQPTLAFRFFEDQTGYAGEARFEWQILSANSVTLDTGAGAITLNTITFDSQQEDPLAFSAIDGASKRLNCAWSGPARPSFSDLFQDDQGLERQWTPLLGDNRYSCTTTLPDGSAITNTITLRSNSSGDLNGLDMRWYLDEAEDLIISSSESIETISELSIQPSDGNSATFTGYALGRPIICHNS